MTDNGSKEAKPNKLKGIRKEQYKCPVCGKTQITSLNPFIEKYCNFSKDISQKGLNYESIGYLSYDKKREFMEFENDVQISRSTVFFHESHYSEEYLKREEENILELLKQQGIEPTGIITTMNSSHSKMVTHWFD